MHQAEISYPIDKAELVWPTSKVSDNRGDYGFHYTPYNFDSSPEADFYEKVLHELNLRADEVEDVYFTGGITNPRQTDLVFQYPGLDGRAHDYTPNFVVHATGDRWLLVEIKMTARRTDPVEGAAGVKAQALHDLADRNPGRVFYRMVFADKIVGQQDVETLRGFLSA